jgi:nicotinate phosphoribosyltransferase
LLRAVPEVRISEFGTRRRHSFLWQEYVVEVMRVALGASLSGTSNTSLAYKHDLEAMGTNAHELPMAMAALADGDDALHESQYRVLELWQKSYGGELLIMLPDTFGTAQFLEGAPDWVADWTGQRCDSKDPFVAGDEYIAWLLRRGRDARRKRLIASDGLDADEILRLHAYFHGRIRFSAGWGTLMTVNGRPAVKLSDNARKATGPESEIARYRSVFGSLAVEGAAVLV